MRKPLANAEKANAGQTDGQMSLVQKAQFLGVKKKKNEPSLDFCIRTKKVPLSNVVMFIFLYLLPKKFDAKF